ncbi:MAG: hypothetical protein Q9163_006109, partial [Psora crenata]
MIAPEVVFAKAWVDKRTAKIITEEMKEFCTYDDVVWTRTHSLLAGMGGFVLEYGQENPAIPVEAELSRNEPSVSHESNPSDGHEPSKGKDNLFHGWTETKLENARAFMRSQNRQRTFVHLDAAEILRLRLANLLDKLPMISEAEINDKSKSDIFAKTIAVCQIIWTVFQLCVRGAQDIAISQLELGVAGFALCAVATYYLNWEKPKEVHVPVLLLRFKTVLPDTVLKILDVKEEDSQLRWLFSLDLRRTERWERRLSGSPVPNDYDGGKFRNQVWPFEMILLTTSLGALHVVAWNWAFPTPTERVLWRVTSIYTTVMLPAFTVFGPLIKRFKGFFPRDAFEFTDYSLAVTGSVLYVLARLFIL